MPLTHKTTRVSLFRRGDALTVLLALLISGGCATLPKGFEKRASTAFTDTQETGLGRMRRAEIKAHPDQSGFLMLGSGLDAFVARAVLARAAERSIDAQYYLLHHDLTGHLLIYELLNVLWGRG